MRRNASRAILEISGGVNLQTVRALAETEAQAILSNIRISPRKLNLVAGLIRGRTAQDAGAILGRGRGAIDRELGLYQPGCQQGQQQ